MRDLGIDQARCDELLANKQVYHSEHQRRWSIVNANSYGRSLYGQLRQALRELASRNIAIEAGELGEREAALEVEDTERLIDGEQNPVVLERLKIKRDRFALGAKQNVHAKQALLEERAHFYEIADRLDKQLGGLTPEKRERLDSEMWHDWIRERLALDLLERGAPLRGTIQAMIDGPPEWRDELLAIVRDVTSGRDEDGNMRRVPGPKRKALARWYTHRDLPALPAEIAEEA